MHNEPPQACWREVAVRAAQPPCPAVDRLLVLRWLVIAGTLLVMARVVTLELAYGPRFRQMAHRPVVANPAGVAARPRILARDGTVLAEDRVVPALAVHYRYLEEPPNEAWLLATARRQLAPRARRQPEALAAELARLRRQHAEVRLALARLCGLDPAEFFARAHAIQRRVQAIRQAVSAPRPQPDQAAMGEQRPPGSPLLPTRRPQLDQAVMARNPGSNQGGLWPPLAALARALADPPAPAAPALIAEELWYHVIHVGLTLPAVAEIEGHPERYPGTFVLHVPRREYPCGASAAHVVGYAVTTMPGTAAAGARLAPPPAECRGVLGAERVLDDVSAIRGRVLQSARTRLQLGDQHAGGRRDATPQDYDPGDLVLTLDPGLQQQAYELLEAAERRRAAPRPAAGALVLVAAGTGEILALASWPAFEPNRLAERATSVTAGARMQVPLDRALRAARPAGGVLAPLVLAALLEGGADEAELSMALRSDRLAELCRGAPARAVLAWAARCGLGQATGIELHGEASGALPLPTALVPERADAASRVAIALASGRRPVLVTPLQLARLMCVCANDGRPVRLCIVRENNLERERSGLAGEAFRDMQADRETAADLPPQIMARVRRMLCEHAVATQLQTRNEDHLVCLVAHPPRSGCMWLAGYAPVQRPRVAFAVLLEQDETPEDALRAWLGELCRQATHTLECERAG